MRKQTKYRLTPVEKAVMRQKWGSAALKAHLQALAGENWNTVVENAAILTFIVGGAADVDKVPNTDPDLRILAGTANALMEIAYNEGIRSADRGALSAGIMAIERLVPRLTDHAMITASMSAQMLMAQGGIYGKHFQDVFKR